nr:HNH endonuclease [Desulfatibacillum aliphaticivorans]
MRPVKKGGRPKDKNGKEVRFTKYAKARGLLIECLGEYCSYCEMHLDASLAVEHVQPKSVNPSKELDWDNFLLACTNCNSTKGNKEIIEGRYLWPDKDNTFAAFKYTDEGLVFPADSLPEALERKARDTISLTGLNKTPLNSKASDRRWLNRRETWGMAEESKKDLCTNNTEQMRKQITRTAMASGYWSIWMTVFQDDPDMVRRFIDSHPGTCRECFDESDNFKPAPRPGGIC